MEDALDHPLVFEARVVPHSFDDWYATAAPRLLASMTLLCRDEHVARDVTAEAMVRALERWRRVSRMEAPEGWVYRVAVNLWKRQARRASLGRSSLARTTPRAEDATTGALPVELRELVAALPTRQREVLVVRLVLGLSQIEAAVLLGIAEGTVASTLADARRAMRTALQPDDEETTR